MPIPLEDGFSDVIGKALRGLRVARPDLAARAGVDVAAVQRLLDGELDEPAARAIAPHLGLGPDSLVALARGAYAPDVAAPAGLAGFSTPYDDFHVNAYMVWDAASQVAVAFDTGSDCGAMLDHLRARGLTLAHVFVTHTHRDHVLCLEALTGATGAPAHVSSAEPLAGAGPIEPGATFQAGGLRIEARSTWGHSKGGITFVVTGLAVPLAIVGDALFAGSMGGGLVSYPDALANNRREIFSLPDETVICPGHGPLTTVGLEKRHNPFYPEFAEEDPNQWP